GRRVRRCPDARGSRRVRRRRGRCRRRGRSRRIRPVRRSDGRRRRGSRFAAERRSPRRHVRAFLDRRPAPPRRGGVRADPCARCRPAPVRQGQSRRGKPRSVPRGRGLFGRRSVQLQGSHARLGRQQQRERMHSGQLPDRLGLRVGRCLLAHRRPRLRELLRRGRLLLPHVHRPMRQRQRLLVESQRGTRRVLRIRSGGGVLGMWVQLLRRVTWLAAAGLLGACAFSPTSGQDPAPRVPYLDDASFRRAELEASLVNPSNAYSQLRLARYASGDGADWERLPEWNPPVEPIVASELDAPGGASTTALSRRAVPLALPATVASEDDPALVALGELAFHRYPTQVGAYFGVGLTSRSAAARYGLWVDETRGVGGLVRARMADGSGAVSLTCSTCHSAQGAEGDLVAGLPNARLDVGAATLAAQGVPEGAATGDPIAAWGPGRVDVTTTAGTEPVRIPDLRPVRWLTHLQQDATVRSRDLTALAIRIETL